MAGTSPAMTELRASRFIRGARSEAGEELTKMRPILVSFQSFARRIIFRPA